MAGTHLDPLGELKHSPDLLAAMGEGKRRGERKKGRERGGKEREKEREEGEGGET